jgi:hypothetical protein
VAGASDHGVQADVRVVGALEPPELVAPLVLEDAGRPVGQAVRDPSVEEVGGLDEMVVDGDQRVEDRSRRRVRQQSAPHSPGE